MYRRILDAAVRVLGEEGALGFTTTRVADEAGVSVGSLYQYFPNKHALVLAVHEADVRAGWEHTESILDHPRWSARRKLTEITEWFFVSEAEEVASLGAVAGDIDVFLRESGRSIDADFIATAGARIAAFVASASPRRRSSQELAFTADLIWTTIESIGKSVAAKRLTHDATVAWARRTATMLADHIEFP